MGASFVECLPASDRLSLAPPLRRHHPSFFDWETLLSQYSTVSQSEKDLFR